jgi:hypothetical protein
MRRRKDTEVKALALARAKEAARYHGLYFDHYTSASGVWVTMSAWPITPPENPQDDVDPVVRVKARGWMNASNAFVRAVTEWAQKQEG